jgi:hypothetical protein
MADVILPWNFNGQMVAFLQKNTIRVACVSNPDAPIPFTHSDGTIWMKSIKVDFKAQWPFETVMSNLKDIDIYA